MEEARERYRRRLLNARRLYMMEIAEDSERRRAWELLTGRAVDWDKAKRGEAQSDEPYPPRFREPGLMLACEAQWLAELTGGPDKTKVLGEAMEAEIASAGRER